MLKRIAAAAFLALLPGLAHAGSFDGTNYRSNLGYSVRPPAGWVRVDAATVKGMEEQALLPSNITAKAFPRIDVIFYPPFSETDTSMRADQTRIEANAEKIKTGAADTVTPPAQNDTKRPNYSASLSIMVVKGMPSSVSTEMAKSYRERLLKNSQVLENSNGNFIKNLNIGEATSGTTAKNYKAFIFESEYDIDIDEKNYHIKSEQTLIVKDGQTYIVTCSSDYNRPPEKLKGNWCRTVVNSLKIE
ncbi:MAG: hypothetical protein IKY83_00085 [Proteobacteria bacterium]|nr:hypothetical protein [Pseudomonadota bacterium]